MNKSRNYLKTTKMIQCKLWQEPNSTNLWQVTQQLCGDDAEELHDWLNNLIIIMIDICKWINTAITSTTIITAKLPHQKTISGQYYNMLTVPSSCQNCCRSSPNSSNNSAKWLRSSQPIWYGMNLACSVYSHHSLLVLPYSAYMQMVILPSYRG